MYSKKILEEICVPSLPVDRGDAVYRVRAIDYILRCRIDKEHKLLIVAFYSRESAVNGFELPTAVLYLSKTEYITRMQVFGSVLWKKSRILHALGIWSSKAVCLRQSDEKAILRFVPEKKVYNDFPVDAHDQDILTCIYRYQTWLIEQNNNHRKKERVLKTNKVMATVPELPDAFHRWVLDEPLKNSRYMYYERTNKKSTECTCTHCRKTSVILTQTVKHCQPGKCPACGSKIIFRSMGRSHRICDKGNSAIMQIAKNGDYLIRFFEHDRSYYGGWDNPDNSSHERARLFFSGNGAVIGTYKYGDSRSLGRYGWHPCSDHVTGSNTQWDIQIFAYLRDWNDWFKPSYLYPYNIRGLLGRLALSYSLKKEWLHKPIDVTTHVMQATKYPFGNLLKAQGLHALSTQLYEKSLQLEKYRRSGPLHECLCVSKELIPALQKHDVSVDALNVITLVENPSEDDIVWLNSCRYLEVVKQLIAYTTMHKIIKYSRQQELFEKRKRNHYSFYCLTYWRDYLQMAKTLGYDTKKKSVLYPKDLMEEHDKMAQLIKVGYDPVVDQGIKNLYPILENEYAFEDSKYLIIPPKDFEDFKNEGVTLLHCVCASKYYVEHIKNNKYIMLLRTQEDPDTPFYTIEYSPSDNRICQCQGYRHKREDDSIKEFTSKWLNYIGAKRRVQESAA